MKFTIQRRHFSFGLLASALAASGLLSGCQPSVPDTIKIGVAQPLSGSIAELGQDMLNGVVLAVEELNKQGFSVNGKPVKLEVVQVDDKADPATGKQVAQQLVDAGVVAVIGHLNSGVSIEAAPVYAAANVAQIAISTNPRYTELGFNTTLRMVANDNLQARAMGSFAASSVGAVRYAVIDEGTTYGKGLAEGAAARLKQLGKEVTVRESFDGTTVAFEPLAAKLKADNTDVIVSMLNDFQAIALLEALGKVGHTNVHFVGGDTVKTAGMIKAAGLVNQISATSPVLNPDEFAAGKNFIAAYETRFKLPVSYGAHYSYDNTYVVADAIRAAKSADRKAVLDALRKLEGRAPVTGTMRWDAKGEQSFGAVGIYQLRGSEWRLRSRSSNW